MYKLWLGLLFASIFSMNILIADDIVNEDGVKLFKQCAGCHGQRGEQHALGKSIAINRMTKQQIITSIEGYVNGTYGGSMRALMKGQVVHLNRAQVEKLAVYVASLNSQHKLKSLSIQVKPQCEVAPVRKAEKYVPSSFKMRVKTKRYAKTLTHVKALIAHESLTDTEAKDKRTKQSYLTKIVFKEDKELILEIKCTPYLSKNLILKFKYQSPSGKKLSMRGYNNLGKSATHSVVIKDNPNSRERSTLHNKVRNKVITSLNDKAIYDYFGDVDLIQSDKIQLTGPDVAANGGSVPIGVRSTIKAKRVSLFASEEDEKPKMIVEWVLHRQALVDFDIKIKLVNYIYSEGNIISAVVEGVDGKLYVTHIKIKLAIAGGDV